MVRKFLLVFVTALMIFASAQTSQAVLNAVDPGPYVNPPFGFFPAWYQDKNGLGLEPCLVVGGPCVLIPDGFFDGINPVVFPTNWPIEFFYWVADPDKAALGGNVKQIRFGLEGSFANLPTSPVNGFQTVFQRIRMRFTAPSAGTYTVTHPFGVKSFTGPATINDTVDVPLGIALDFTTALTGAIGPFLQWDPAVLPLAPAGFLGDAVTPHPVIGSPFGTNFVRIDGPNIGGAGINFVQTSNFILAGKISTAVLPTPLTVTRTTYGISPAHIEQVEVFANSAPTATLTFNDGALATNPMAGDGSGRFFGESFPGVAPLTVAITATNPGNAPTTSLPSNVVDVVTIARAEYSAGGLSLTVQAASSDNITPLILTVVGFGPITPNVPTVITGVTAAPPAFVTVTSSEGGVTTAPVVIVP